MPAAIDASPSEAPPMGILGAGALGTALARRLAGCGYRVEAVVSRRAESAEALAERVGAPVASDAPAALPEAVGLLFVCVPDDAIEPVAERLAGLGRDWTKTVVAHTSGARTADALAPLARAGAAPLSFHPMQTFPPDAPPEAFDGIVVTLQGSEAAVEAGDGIARALGARPVRLSGAGKAVAHCAAALASNGLVALVAAARRLLEAADVGDPEATALLRPLVEQTWDNLQKEPPGAALTGPAVRGDRGTVEAHLEALAEAAPELAPLYTALSGEMVRLGRTSGRLDAEAAEAVLDALSEKPPPAGTRGRTEPGAGGESA
jgi:predicted short-subunit dehydrogenase-like oxidoreductase (DUF2520 family)